MTDEPRYTNRCACGWEISGGLDEVVDATIDHGRRIHNMEATREQVIEALHAAAGNERAGSQVDRRTA